MKQYVIIGNGIAAAGCIEGIRSKDTEGLIVVISKEPYPVYCRPLISYYLEGKTTLDKIGYRNSEFYEKNLCDVLYGETVDEIDIHNKTVRLSNGKSVSFSKLCVATGSSPFVPFFEGLDLVKNFFSFMTLDDTLSLEKAITPDSKVLIIGAGLIGLKCAEGLYNKVKKITVCDRADNILSSILDGDTAPIAQRVLEKHGIDFLLSTSVDRFEQNKAIMQGGEIIDFDILVMAVGVRANTTLVSKVGGNVNRGIWVNKKMQTSLDSIYSAGDCTEGYDVSSGVKRVIALLPNAYMQGFTAGVNMTGETKTFDSAIPMNSIGLFGLHIMTAGSYIEEKDGGSVFMNKGDTSCKKFFVQDGLLKGYILVDNVERGGIYTSLIRDRIPLESVDFNLLAENPSFMAFSAESRRNKFGGVV